jgi:hypothetical protein
MENLPNHTGRMHRLVDPNPSAVTIDVAKAVATVSTTGPSGSSVEVPEGQCSTGMHWPQ